MPLALGSICRKLKSCNVVWSKYKPGAFSHMPHWTNDHSLGKCHTGFVGSLELQDPPEDEEWASGGTCQVTLPSDGLSIFSYCPEETWSYVWAPPASRQITFHLSELIQFRVNVHILTLSLWVFLSFFYMTGVPCWVVGGRPHSKSSFIIY